MNFECFYDEWEKIPIVDERLSTVMECQTVTRRGYVVKVNLHVDPNGHVLVFVYNKRFDCLPMHRILDVRIFDQACVFKQNRDMNAIQSSRVCKGAVYHPMTITYIDEKIRYKNVFTPDAGRLQRFAECLFNLSQNVYVKHPSAYDLHMIEREIFVQSAISKLIQSSIVKKTYKIIKNQVCEPRVKISNMMRNLTPNISNQKCMKNRALSFLKLYYLKEKGTKYSRRKLTKIHIEDMSETLFLRMTWQLLSEEIFKDEWKKLCASPKDGLTIDEFRAFIKSQNGEEIPEEYAERIAANFCIKVDSFVDKLEWTIFMLSEHCSLVPSTSFGQRDSMDFPFSHYYINSSHNTYLDGHQLFGNSSVLCYRKALMSGCRCVELDVWDDSSTNEPKITHGKTMVSNISFRETLREIKESAFKTSPYPVILSIENHCSQEYKEIMAQIIRDVLGDIAVSECALSHPRAKGVSLPPPGMYKGKILIKDKLPKGNYSTVPQEFMYEKYIRYFQASHFRGFEAAMQQNLTYLMCSMDENKSLTHATEDPYSYSKYNESHITRVYPMGLRIQSGNYNPMPHWRVGCQLVALNIQTDDEFTRVNKAMFETNLNCGYVLKPDITSMLTGADKKTSKSNSVYKMKILYVLCLGATESSIKVEYEYIDIFSDGGFRKSFCNLKGDLIRPLNHVMSLTTVDPSFSFLVVSFYRSDGDVIGRRFLRLMDMRPGLRSFTLNNKYGYPLPKAVVFCSLNIENPKPKSASHAAKASQRDRSELIALYGKQKENRKNPLVDRDGVPTIASSKSFVNRETLRMQNISTTGRSYTQSLAAPTYLGGVCRSAETYPDNTLTETGSFQRCHDY